MSFINLKRILISNLEKSSRTSIFIVKSFLKICPEHGGDTAMPCAQFKTI